MKTSPDFFAEQAYQILLARVQSTARLQSRLGNAFRLHLTQPAQTRRADRNRQQTFFNEHRRVRLVESVDRRQEDVDAALAQSKESGRPLLLDFTAAPM